ncbi:MAG: O-antigen ligase family protein [Glaciihabitans sp.]
MLRLVFVVALLPWQVAYLLPSTAVVRRAVNALILGGAVSGGGTLLQLVAGGGIIPGGEVTDQGRFTGFTGHVSDAGGIAALTVVLSLSGLTKASARMTKFVSLIGLTGGALGLILSGSVSAMIAVAAGVIVLLLLKALRFQTAILMMLLAGAAFLFAIGLQSGTGALSPVERIEQTLGLSADGRYNTSETRIETYGAAFDGFLASPLVGNGLDPASALADGIFPAHNLFVGAMFQGGLFLACGLALAIVLPLGRWIRLSRSVLVAQVLAGFTAMVVFAMTAPSLYNRYLWIPVALLFALKRIEEARPHFPKASERSAK